MLKVWSVWRIYRLAKLCRQHLSRYIITLPQLSFCHSKPVDLTALIWVAKTAKNKPPCVAPACPRCLGESAFPTTLFKRVGIGIEKQRIQKKPSREGNQYAKRAQRAKGIGGSEKMQPDCIENWHSSVVPRLVCYTSRTCPPASHLPKQRQQQHKRTQACWLALRNSRWWWWWRRCIHVSVYGWHVCAFNFFADLQADSKGAPFRCEGERELLQLVCERGRSPALFRAYSNVCLVDVD